MLWRLSRQKSPTSTDGLGCVHSATVEEFTIRRRSSCSAVVRVPQSLSDNTLTLESRLFLSSFSSPFSSSPGANNFFSPVFISCPPFSRNVFFDRQCSGPRVILSTRRNWFGRTLEGTATPEQLATPIPQDAILERVVASTYKGNSDSLDRSAAVYAVLSCNARFLGR